MQRIVFWLYWPLLKGLSLLPLWFIYGLADLVFLIMYYVVGYRKGLVYNNLKRSFPDKGHKELLTIRRGFYRYLSDFFMETAKGLSTSRAFIEQHYRLQNPDVLQKDIHAGVPVMIVLGHTGNWEWGSQAIGHQYPGVAVAPVAPLRNKELNKVMLKNRARTGVRVLPKKELIPTLASEPDSRRMVILIADQSPHPKRYHIVDFLNQETAAVTGMERIAREYRHKVYYASTVREKRGYYTIEFIPIENGWREQKEGSLTAAFMKMLEKDIIKHPTQYLWSHNRWKLTTNRRT